MSGKAIGKNLGFGYPGNVARSIDTVIAAYPTPDDKIPFGTPVILNADNSVSAVNETNTEPIIGIAVRRIMQPKEDREDGWYYEQGDSVDVLTRGTISVAVEAGLTITPMDPAYVNLETGEITNETDTTGYVPVPNARFTTGRVDADNITELLITQRSV